MKYFYTTVFLLLFSFGINYAQPLRKSEFSVASAYIVGRHSLIKEKSNQYLFWGRYAFSSLDALSFGYKKSEFKNSEYFQRENFFTIGAELNFFPFYFFIDYAKATGRYDEPDTNRNVKSNILAAEIIYYKSLFFYSLSSEYVSTNLKNNETVLSIIPEITWRPSKDFSVSVFNKTSKLNSGNLYNSPGYSVYFMPLDFVSFFFKEYFGKRKYDFDVEFKVFYGLPYVENGARIFYVSFYPWRNLALIFNYEHHKFEYFAQEYYSVSLRYDFIF